MTWDLVVVVVAAGTIAFRRLCIFVSLMDFDSSCFYVSFLMLFSNLKIAFCLQWILVDEPPVSEFPKKHNFNRFAFVFSFSLFHIFGSRKAHQIQQLQWFFNLCFPWRKFWYSNHSFNQLTEKDTVFLCFFNTQILILFSEFQIAKTLLWDLNLLQSQRSINKDTIF